MMAHPTFTQRDLTRALKGAIAAGLPIHGVSITGDNIRIITSSETPIAHPPAETNDATPGAFDRWKEKNARKA